MTTLIPNWVFDDTPIPDPHGRAARMLQFADILRHPKADGPDKRPLRSKWQRRIIERIYGPSDESGKRQVKTVFILLPRGARKTTLASVLALGHTIGPEQRPGGQVVSAASDRTQARLAFDEASDIIRSDPRLLDATRLRDTKNRIEHKKSRSNYVAISADGDAQHGKTPIFVLADELHVWRGFSLWNALKTGASKTPVSLTIVITTAGERPEGICWDLFQYALRCHNDPTKDPSFLPILFQADARADWDDEELWRLVNPGLDEGFPDLDELRAEARLARELPKLREGFKQTHLNVWADGSAAGWVEMAVYDEASDPINEDALEGKTCWIAVDMSKSYDLTAIVAAFPHEDGGHQVLTFPFLPEAAFKRRMQEEPDIPWQQWREEGSLTVIPGDLIDDGVIEAKIRELYDTYDVQEIAFDPKFAAKIMANLIADDLPAVELPQRPLTMGPFYNEMQKAIIARRFRHGGHPVLRWCVQNAVPIYGDTGLPYLSKKKSTKAIDCIVAAAMATGRADAGGGGPSIYEDEDERPHGLLFV
ncbi:terminase large subunit [Microvirga sp. M2]|uniref:terminase large subunit n=1 Tax=Microvirga sp. M2 TaxID=3073270 RepID=UPI0039C19CE9